jgi:hypothetical protein
MKSAKRPLSPVTGRIAGAATALGLMASAPFALAQEVPNPTTVSGPIPARAEPGAPSHDYPWLATMHNLEAAGYVEEEFFYEGVARSFDAEGEVVSSGHPYKTRMLVRRPADPADFNGVVLAEWQNVTAGYDLDAMWGGSFEHIVRAGYAWVGISAQRVGLHADNGLIAWSPTRYGTLDVTAGGQITDDSLSYDIYAQGMEAIRDPQGVNVLGGATAEAIIAMGASQSAGRLGRYINSLHDQLGGPVDAYYLFIGGAGVPEDLDVPVFKMLTETDVPGGTRSRQADTDMFRHWEVAGTSHSSRRTSMNAGPLVTIGGVERTVPVCNYPTYPRTPTNYVLSASYDHIANWVLEGVSPPTAPKVEVDSATIQRDARGNALGGIRLAEVDPAVSISTGENAGDGFCRLYGRYEPFDDATIAGLYPSHAAYVAAANARTDANLAAGYILAPDAMDSRLRAEQSIYGKGLACEAACHAAQDVLDASYFYLALSDRKLRMTRLMAGIVETIARGQEAQARTDLRAWMGELRAMERNGELTSITVDALSDQVDAVYAAL